MTFSRTTDYALIKSIVTHAKVYPHVSDDFSPAVDKWQPTQSDFIWYVLVEDGAEVLGLWILLPENAICWNIHTCLLPTAYGRRAREASKLVVEWIWSNTPCRRITTNVPKYNRLALNFARRAGLKQYGVNADSYQKNGLLHDQILLGISKPCPY